ncbi:MAG: HEPN domain-containing protein, partial [Patescibacteria group bacterium]
TVEIALVGKYFHTGEKYFKAFLAFQGKNVRKVHDLNALLTLCLDIDASFNELKSEADSLDKFYTETRYPGNYPEFTFKEAENALQAAIRIKGFVLSKIKNE